MRLDPSMCIIDLKDLFCSYTNNESDAINIVDTLHIETSILNDYVTISSKGDSLAQGLSKMKEYAAQYEVDYAEMSKHYYSSEYYDDQFNKSDDELIAKAVQWIMAHRDSVDPNLYNSGASSYNTSGYKKEAVYASTELRNCAADIVNSGMCADFITKENLISELAVALNATVYGTHMDSKYNLHTNGDYHVDKIIENAAAYYAFYSDQAARLFEGDKLTEAMNTINEAFPETLEHQFSDVFESEFAYLDSEGLRDSIYTMFKERAQVYSDVLADGSFSLGVEGTENSWLSDSSFYVSAKLRNHVDASDELNPAVQTKSNAKYTAEDIKAMKQYSRERLETEDYHTYNEEHLGFMMGFNRALANSIGDNIAVSDNGRALLANAIQRHEEQELERVQALLAWQRQDSYQTKEYKYDSFDIKSVLDAAELTYDKIRIHGSERGLIEALKCLDNIVQDKRNEQAKSASVQFRYADLSADKGRINGPTMLELFSGAGSSKKSLDWLCSLLS